MDKKRLRIGIITDFPLVKTGFARNARALLPILYKKDKWDIFCLNQGMSDGDQNFQKLPWKNFGVFKNFDQQRFQQDQGYQRMIAYGNSAVEEFVTSNRLDICVHIQDIWSSSIDAYLKSDWYKHIKQNFAQWSTADSNPLLPDFIEWAKECPNLWFWTSFAEREVKRDYPELAKNCRTVHGAIESKDFYPLSQKERLELRRKFGISDNEKICIYLGRNQLRKQFWALMEGLVEFRRNNPTEKLRLFFHCYAQEPGGWPLERIRQELKLKPEDILYTYYCRNCADWNIQPYQGEDLDCLYCKGQKTRITAGVGSTITEKELNQIYNIADGACSCPTSAGLELFHCEALLSGVPLATVPYAGAEEFTPNDFVYTIKGTFTREIGTGFKKFTPNIYSISRFYEFICKLTNDKKKKIVEAGRKWTIEQFDSNNIANILEQFFDKCQPIDWDSYFNRKKDIKNVNAQVQNLEKDHDFILHCYKTILNMDLDEKDSGYQHWAKFLLQPGDKNQLREQMTLCFRNAAVEHNKKVIPPTPFESLLDNTGNKRLLLVIPQSIGDCFLSTSLFESIKENYPNTDIYLATQPQYFEIFEGNPYIHKIIPYNPAMDSEIWATGQWNNKGFFDHYIFLTAGSQKVLNYLTNSNVLLPKK